MLHVSVASFLVVSCSMSLPPHNNIAPKILTPAQQAWLDIVIQSMNNTINKHEPLEETRLPLQKASDYDCLLAMMNYSSFGTMREAQAMQWSKGQMPDFYGLWVARRAAMGRGPPTKKYLNPVWQDALARGEITSITK
ncbi:uncharacterized protein VP01_4465g1 [Puccinia sorghi]|uniref:Uncharacterized protein n=1 Tax=Puccinia sorghi TaxID=27349 RepID=A0A0L6UPB1_9BASI|nr:uncharacterized protein VP01_4465g1 [Puccinia sorghi]